MHTIFLAAVRQPGGTRVGSGPEGFVGIRPATGDGTPVASKHEQNRAEKRERLVKAAVDAFIEAGYANTTVSDIVHRAGLTPSTFYNYYRDKDALRDEMLAVAAGRMVAALAEIRAKAKGVEEYLSMACRGLLVAIVEDQETSSLLQRNLPLMRLLVDDRALRPVYDAVVADVTAAAGRGELAEADATLAAAVLRAASVEIAVVAVSRGDVVIDAAVDFLTRVLATALKPR